LQTGTFLLANRNILTGTLQIGTLNILTGTLVAENKTTINQQLGLNGPDKARTLTTTVRLKSIENKARHATDALKPRR
jgi:hypothetical protein